jgi:hypothetical protein
MLYANVKKRLEILYNAAWYIQIAIRITYSERASKTNHRMLRGNINGKGFTRPQASNRDHVDHHTTFASFVLTHVLESQ